MRLTGEAGNWTVHIVIVVKSEVFPLLICDVAALLEKLLHRRPALGFQHSAFSEHFVVQRGMLVRAHGRFDGSSSRAPYTTLATRA